MIGMSQVSSGDTVRVHYTGRLGEGEVFDSSRQREPLEFTVGVGQVIPGFERAVEGMAPGEEKTVTVPAEQAYGPRRDELLLTVERGRLPAHLEPEVGQQLQMNQGGQVAVVTVAEVSRESVTLDANHPLAGRELTFELELVEIV
jgi:peptidylprolyl isomerase